jgi:hypothetical protein
VLSQDDLGAIPFDSTGWLISAQCRTAKDQSAPLLFTFTASFDRTYVDSVLTQSLFNLTLTKAQTALFVEQQGYYDVALTDLAGNVHNHIEGPVQIGGTVTHV